MNFRRRCLVWSLTVVVVCGVVSSARAEETPPKKTPLPKSGTLSTSVSSGSANNKLPATWGDDNVYSDEAAPISGSVSRMNPSTWMMKIFNNSKDTYSVNLSVIQRDSRGTQVKSDSMSFTLKAGQNDSKSLSASPNSVSASLELRGHTNLSERQREREKKLKGADAADTAVDGSGGSKSSQVPAMNK